MVEPLLLCRSQDLTEAGPAVPFDVVCEGQVCRAFAVRAQGQVQAYLNRCTHIAMEMDYQPNRFFDDSGKWLMCATHGATYDAATGACMGGPCRGSLKKIVLVEQANKVLWCPSADVLPLPSTTMPPSVAIDQEGR